MLNIDDLFKGRHFDREIIILCARWCLRFKLSFRDLVEMMGERGLYLAHTTIMRWIQRYAPEFEKCWNRFVYRAGASWRVDETHVKIKGRWTYLYRAVDKDGKTALSRLWILFVNSAGRSQLACLNINALGRSCAREISSEIAYSWPM
jgi:transposase-like protein